MRSTVEIFWDALERERARLNSSQLPLVLNEEMKENYINRCDTVYKTYKERFMQPSVRNLDRHKVAAILVVEGASLNLICLDKDDGGKIFLGTERVLLTCALAYLLDQFNFLLDGGGVEGAAKADFPRMAEFRQPGAFACDTKYVDIMSRNLHYTLPHLKLFESESALDVHLNVVRELAEKFFLLEYISIAEFYKSKAEKVYTFLRRQARKAEE